MVINGLPFKCLEKKELVKDKFSIDQNIQSQKFKVIDARSKDRFEGKVIEPRKGLWTLPAGFLELGETLQEGALRETKEETNSTVKIDDIYFMFDIPQIGQFYVLYKASIEENSYSPTTESLEVELFSYDEIPWDELAFPFVPIALEQFYEDLNEDYFPLRIRELIKK